MQRNPNRTSPNTVLQIYFCNAGILVNQKYTRKDKCGNKRHSLLPASPLLDLQHDDRSRPDVVVGKRVGVLEEERVQLQLLLARRHPGLLVQPRLECNS